MSFLIDAVVSMDLGQPDRTIGENEDQRLVQEDVLIHEKGDKTCVNRAVQNCEFPFDRGRITLHVLIVHFENLLNQSHLEHEALQEISTRWKPQEFVVGSHSDEHEMLPK